ncbi:MAG: PadR family transcriptional regulator [Dehalococcoidales bacterium]
MNAKEISETNKDFQKGLYTGISVFILLCVVGRSKEPIYGYQIAKIIEKDNEDIPIIKLGTLYPVLRALERDGLLESKVDPSVTGPPRKYYRITELGLLTLAELRKTWQRATTFIDSIMIGAEDGK